jgi:hypothetical protein
METTDNVACTKPGAVWANAFRGVEIREEHFYLWNIGIDPLFKNIYTDKNRQSILRCSDQIILFRRR